MSFINYICTYIIGIISTLPLLFVLLKFFSPNKKHTIKIYHPSKSESSHVICDSNERILFAHDYFYITYNNDNVSVYNFTNNRKSFCIPQPDLIFLSSNTTNNGDTIHLIFETPNHKPHVLTFHLKK